MRTYFVVQVVGESTAYFWGTDEESTMSAFDRQTTGLKGRVTECKLLTIQVPDTTTLAELDALVNAAHQNPEASLVRHYRPPSKFALQNQFGGAETVTLPTAELNQLAARLWTTGSIDEYDVKELQVIITRLRVAAGTI